MADGAAPLAFVPSGRHWRRGLRTPLTTCVYAVLPTATTEDPLPSARAVDFDECASSAGPYYLVGSAVRVDGTLYRVASVTRVDGSRKRARLESVDFPTAAERAAAQEWQWDPGAPKNAVDADPKDANISPDRGGFRVAARLSYPNALESLRSASSRGLVNG